MRRIAAVAAIAACGCACGSSSGPAPRPLPPLVAPAAVPDAGAASSSDVAVAVPAARRACAVPTSAAAPDPITHVAWRAGLGAGTGALVLDAAEHLVVSRFQGGRSVAFDLDTGVTCAVLVEAPGGAGPAPAIDPYTARSAVAHGLLVGPSKFGVAAIDLESGQPRWTRDLAGTAREDEYALRDGLQVVAVQAAIVAGFRVRHRAGDSFRHEELVVALEPKTGRELWRATSADHKPGEPIHVEGTVRIDGDRDRVLVRSPGELRALDGATGKPLWSTAWTPVPPSVGPWTPARRGPLVASDGAHVAIAFPNRIQLHDARTGARSGEVAVAGMATELIARGGAVYAALEVEPGTAAVTAIDAAARRVRWSRPAAYSVQRLRADDELVYALDGNGRVWGLELAGGAPRFGLSAPGFDFVVARTRTGESRIVAAAGADLVALAPVRGAPPPLDPFARWEVERRADRCHPRALAWIDGEDRVAWQRELPARVRALGFGPCEEQELASYRRNPRATGAPDYAVLGVADAGGSIVEADLTGVLALRKTDGAVLLDAGAPSADPRDSLFFDDGTFELQGVPGCTGPSRRAHVFARCGERLVYFNGTTVLVIALDKPRVEARGRYQRTAVTVTGVRTEATIAAGPFALVLKGITYMR